MLDKKTRDDIVYFFIWFIIFCTIYEVFAACWEYVYSSYEYYDEDIKRIAPASVPYYLMNFYEGREYNLSDISSVLITSGKMYLPGNDPSCWIITKIYPTNPEEQAKAAAILANPEVHSFFETMLEHYNVG